MAKALDMAVILDYWGREPGEMVMRGKGHEGEMIDVFEPGNFPPCLWRQETLQRRGWRV